jgi:hypothetical protein
MPCSSCGGAKRRVYLVTTANGEQHEVDTLTAAINIVRAKGGSYQIAKR